MIQLGHYALVASMLFCAYGMVVALVGGRTKNLPLIRSAENSVIANAVLIGVASIALWVLFLRDEFLVEYVANYSAAAMPTQFKFTAFWGGQKGSLLLWALVLVSFSLVAVLQNRHRNRDLMPYVAFCLLGIMLFFSLLLNFAANPFETLPGRPVDGQGLNPLLQNIYMIIHPPMLFLGYVGLAIPFAFSMAALMSGRTDTSWIHPTRSWTLVSWVFLTLGLTLGGRWAYEELGWGGYWAWDPVENASFMPWLVATAFLHSIMVTEKKGMLKLWNFVLIVLAFELTIFGTFITRSGIISSVHSFALSNIGPFFVVFLALSTSFALFWIFYRSNELRSELRMRSFLSREATFLLNNWLFISICFAVFWGTVFPILSEWARGEKISVAAPFFNQVNWPLGLALLTLTGICPLIAWRKASFKNFRRNFLFPLSVGLLTGVVLVILGMRHWISLAFFSSSAFVLMTIALEFFKGARARQSIRPSGFLTALKDLTLANKRRYGGFIIHGGTVLVFIGIIASSFFSVDKVFTVQSGESFELKAYSLTYAGLLQRKDPEKDVAFATIEVSENGKSLGKMFPQKHFHHKSEQPATEVAIQSRFYEDLYIVLSGWDESGSASFHVFINPLVQLIWIGIGIMGLGGVFVIFPDRKPSAARASGKVPEEAQEESA
ncbi:MAG TPA: heme lyase CcmF/NrfE family subunit [Acidobacteriota bacterium]|nr:heme lyase CcmF/NrfE family subunit [Acidobacteriota bacterium]